MKQQEINITLVIMDLGVGGAERVLVNLANHWATQPDFKVHLIALGNTPPFYELNEQVHLIQLGLIYETSSLFEAFKANYHRLKILRQTLKKVGPTVIISFMTVINILSILASYFLKAKLIIADRANPALNESKTWQVITKLFYRFADVLVVQTKGVCSYYKNHSVPLEVIPNPLLLNNPEEQLFPVREKLIVMVGRLHQQKRMDLGIEAYATLKQTANEWKLLILGEGEERDKLEQLIKNRKLEEQVFLKGKVTNVFPYLRNAAIFLMTSEAEGYPNVLIEAMGMGLACVTTDCDYGPAEIIKPNFNGSLVPSGDVTAIATALKQYMIHEDLRIAHGQEARKIKDELRLPNIARQWESLFPLPISSPRRVILKSSTTN